MTKNAYLALLCLATVACSELRMKDGASEGGTEDVGDASTAPVDVSDAAEACTTDCDEEGKTKCGDMTHVQICENHDGCWRWTTRAACDLDQICCDALCVVATESTCYTCGTRGKCEGSTPVCDHVRKGCVCSDASCRALSLLCDSATGSCLRDPSHVYVDGSAPGSGDGTKAHPYRSITAALVDRPSVSTPMVIEVAAGRYDEAHDEKFPLVLRGITLHGAGLRETIIAGTGTYDASASPGMAAELQATVVMGDNSLPSGLSDVTIYEAVPYPLTGHHGIFCDQGNTPPRYDPTVPPNTRVSAVVVGPGYDAGIVATTSAGLGCNVLVTGTTFDIFSASTFALSNKIPQTGVWGVGVENPTPGACAIAVMVQLGDGTQGGGDRFIGSNIYGAKDEVGVVLDTCVNYFVSSFSLFRDASVGIDIRQPGHGTSIAYHSVLTKNTFYQLYEYGVRARGPAAKIDDFSDNDVEVVRPRASTTDEAVGLLVEGAHVVKARRNTFQYNMIGVVFKQDGTDIPGGDFGTSTDPGHNLFHCNWSGAVGPPVGGDVMILNDDGIWSFGGNEWDHAPPTTSQSLTVDGTDMVVIDPNLNQLDGVVTFPATGLKLVDCAHP